MTLTAVPYPYTVVPGTVQNRLANPALGALTGSSPTSWSLAPGSGGGAGTLTVETATPDNPAPLGSEASRIAYWLQTGTTSGQSSVSATGVPGSVAAGQTSTASIWVRPHATRPLAVSLVYLDGGGAVVGTFNGPTADAPGDEWTERSVTGVAPVGATNVRLTVTMTTPMAAARWLRVAGARVTNTASVAPYFEVGYPRVGARAEWNGTAHASTSNLNLRAPSALASTVTLPAPPGLLDFNAERTAAAVLHDVLGRPDPLAALGVTRTRVGSFDAWCADEADANALLALYGLGRVVMLVDTDRPTLDMYHIATRASARPDGSERRRWVVSVDYTEVYGTASAW